MTDLAQGQADRPGIAIPSPSSIRPRPVAAATDSGRAAARAALDAALSGVDLTGSDRRFLARLSQWDKRNATSVASLVLRARHSGRAEAGLSARQLDTVRAALMDAFAYRTSGAAAAGCWDCASRPSGLCGEHARDADRARAFADLAAALDGEVTPTALPLEVTPTALPREVTPAALPRLGAIPGFRQRAPVAS